MELDPTWTCHCGATNTGDVFSDPCWKCGDDWNKERPKIEEAKDVCPECLATDGFHKLHCPTLTLPK